MEQEEQTAHAGGEAIEVDVENAPSATEPETHEPPPHSLHVRFQDLQSEVVIFVLLIDRRTQTFRACAEFIYTYIHCMHACTHARTHARMHICTHEDRSRQTLQTDTRQERHCTLLVMPINGVANVHILCFDIAVK